MSRHRRQQKKRHRASWPKWVMDLKPSTRGKLFGRHYAEYGALRRYGIPSWK